MFYLTDYTKPDDTQVVFTKSRLLGIAHEKYTSKIDNYNNAYVTRYDSNILEKDGQFALEMDNLTGLPENFLPYVVEGQSDNEGWFITE